MIDYEKKYNEAVERAKQIAAQGGASRFLVTQIFPDLAESEDERVIRTLLSLIKDHDWINGATKDECVSWLKKQKEHVPENEESGTRKEPKLNYFDDLEDAAREFRAKNLPPIEPISDELVEIIKGEFEGFRNLLKKKGIDYEPQRGYWEGFARLFDSSAREYVKEQKPAWSEEDEAIVKFYEDDCNSRIGNMPMKNVVEMRLKFKDWITNRIKSLRPQPHWKPSEEQIKALYKAIEDMPEHYGPKAKIEELANNLLELK